MINRSLAFLCAIHLFAYSCVSSRLKPLPQCGSQQKWSSEIFGVRPRLLVGTLDGERQEAPCATFSLSREKVQKFFQYARVIRGSQAIREYPWYPCAQKGKIFLDAQTFEWSIGPEGKGEISQAGRIVYFLACDCFEECKELFPWGGNELFHEEALLNSETDRSVFVK